jgi:hypothetical protein
MSQQLTIGGSITLVNNNLRTIIGLSDSFTTTGSNSISSNANIPTGSWTVVDQGSDTNFRYGFFTNLDPTSSCKIAINSTGSYSNWLQPGDVAVVANSGSAVIYAQAYGANSPIILQYLLTEQ